jgi:hypothetical protein
LSQLIDSAPEHPFVIEFQNKERDFDFLAKQYALPA